MKKIKKIITLEPFFLLTVCFLLSVLLLFTNKETKDFELDIVINGYCLGSVVIPKLGFYYQISLPVLSQIIGTSIRTNLRELYFMRRAKMCAYPVVATVGLMFLNIYDIVNIIHPFVNKYEIYNFIIAVVFFVLTTILFINNRILCHKLDT